MIWFQWNLYEHAGKILYKFYAVCISRVYIINLHCSLLITQMFLEKTENFLNPKLIFANCRNYCTAILFLIDKNKTIIKNIFKVKIHILAKNYVAKITYRKKYIFYKNFLDIKFVDNQNLTRLSVIGFCSIYLSTVNYSYLLKTYHEKILKISYIENSKIYLLALYFSMTYLLKNCHAKIMKISYIENSATYLTVFLLFFWISEIKSLKNYPFVFYADRLYLYFLKVNFQAHFLKHYKLYIIKNLLSSNNLIFYHGS